MSKLKSIVGKGLAAIGLVSVANTVTDETKNVGNYVVLGLAALVAVLIFGGRK